MIVNQILIFGFGYCSQALIHKLKRSKRKIFVVTRNKSSINKLRRQGINSCLWTNEKLVKQYIKQSYIILITVPPSYLSDPVKDKFSKYFLNSKNKLRLIYLSSTSVYGDHNGAWVNENSNLKPSTRLGKWRLNAEKKWLSFGRSNKFHLTILRLSGIYGPDRSPFDRIERKSFKIIKKPRLFFSRIHIEDIVNVIIELLNKNNNRGIFNLSDNMPASTEDIYKEAFKLLNLKPPTPVGINDINLSETAIGFFSESKKISNKKLLNKFHYRLIYPDYIKGLKDIFNKLKQKKF